jgi:Tol biopolymer transport system component
MSTSPQKPTTVQEFYTDYTVPAYFAFCFLSCFPFIRGRVLLVSGFVAHAVLFSWIVTFIRDSGDGTLFLICPIFWWLMCLLRYREGRPTIHREAHTSGPLCTIVWFCFLWATMPVHAQEFRNVAYLCVDWGPAMTLPHKEAEKPKFNDAEDEIYFIKQTGLFTRKVLPVSNSPSETYTQDIAGGVSIYLCKMKPDGNAKMEIKELWRNPAYPIDTQDQSTWMNVNRQTHKIVVSVTYAGSDITGLWTMNLDGSDLKRIITPERKHGHVQAIDHPSWTPDGQWIVFEERTRGTRPQLSDIVTCDGKGGQLKRLLVATTDVHYAQPSVSPDGKQILYVHWFKWASWIAVVNLDGSNPHTLPNPENKQFGTHGGTYPAWSPDGKRILFSGVTASVVTVSTDKAEHLTLGGEGTWGWPLWGKPGIVGHAVRGLLVTDSEFKEAKLIGPSHLAQCDKDGNTNCRW